MGERERTVKRQVAGFASWWGAVAMDVGEGQVGLVGGRERWCAAMAWAQGAGEGLAMWSSGRSRAGLCM